MKNDSDNGMLVSFWKDLKLLELNIWVDRKKFFFFLHLMPSRYKLEMSSADTNYNDDSYIVIVFLMYKELK